MLARRSRASGGVERGTLILELNGKSVNDANELAEYRFHDAAGRDRKSEDLAEWRHARSFRGNSANCRPRRGKAMNHNEGASKEALEGVSVENLDADTAKELGLPPSTKGVVVTGVDPSSPKADSACARVT